MSRRYRIAVGLLVSIALLIVVVLVSLARNESADPYDRTVGLDRVEAVFEVAGLSTRVCLCAPDRTIEVEHAGFSTPVDLYGYDRLLESETVTSTPLVLIVHGNAVRGRQLAPYRVLATELAERGAIVAIHDQLGFGQSDDPFARGPEAARLAYDRAALANEVLLRLVQEVPVDSDRITVVGHSGGALPALKLALESPDVSAAVLVGPPRRVEERSEDSTDVAYFADRFRDTYRWVYGRDLPDWLEPEHLAAEGPYALEDYLEWSTAPGLGEVGHVPVLFVDGGREDPRELAYLDAFLDRVEEPRRLLRQERANHYLNAAESLVWIVYDSAVIEELAGAIEEVLDRPG